MKLQPRYFLLVIALLFGGSNLVNVLLHRRIETERASYFGKYKESQVLGMAQTLCAVLGSDREVLTYQFSKIRVTGIGGMRRQIWQVVCIDGEGNYRNLSNWDADTGDLLSLSHRSDLSAITVDPIKTEQAAVRAARNWLRELQIVPRTSACRLLEPPQRTGQVWFVLFRMGERMVRVSVDNDTGALMTLWSWRGTERYRI